MDQTARRMGVQVPALPPTCWVPQASVLTSLIISFQQRGVQGPPQPCDRREAGHREGETKVYVN
jgi:hypothetical protein